jgi:hypothetical protein
MFASRNQALAVNPNINYNPNPNFNNTAMLPNNLYNGDMPPAPPIVNNTQAQNTPPPAPPIQQQESAGLGQLTPLALLELALLKDADRAFDKFRDWKSTKDLNGNPKKLEKLRETVEAFYENVRISFIDINPKFEEDTDAIDVPVYLYNLANVTKAHYPQFFEKINSIVGQAWLADFNEYIKEDSDDDDDEENNDNIGTDEDNINAAKTN